MTRGPVLSLSVAAAAVVALGAAALDALWLRGAGGTTLAESVLMGFAVHAASALAVLAPVWIGVRWVLARSGQRLSAAAEKGDGGPVRWPAWLGPVSGLVDRANAAWARRAEESSLRLKEADIRQKVIDAERDHLEGVLHSLRDAVLVTDGFNEITVANEPAARLFGFEADGALHKPVDDVIFDDRLRTLIKEVRSSGVPNKQRHVEHALAPGGSARAGGQVAFDVTLASLPDSRNGVGGVVTILRDVTREKEISQMKSDFVSQASHELRTPLSSINAYVEMLLDGEARDEASKREFYQIIKSETERVSRMIDNMLNISRIEAGIVQAERTEVDFVKVCKDVIETMQPQARAKNIMLLFKAGPLVYTAQADRDMMHQVVMNLVSNGIKYTPDGGRVTVTVDNDDAARAVLVSVSDTGLGIPPDALGRIFEKFYRIESYKRVAKGTGLGLNLVRHIVETVHQGRIGVTSELGMGSRFWFSIPYESEGSR
ncbi:MAG: PAS domain-containing protein [Phycisphaerales bacterium]|nr:PAS domain-containing protein [Phycisphaerales bacterium]